MAEQFSWAPPPCCAWAPLPIKSLALSACVSSWTIHFQVLDKSPFLGSGRGHPSCNICIYFAVILVNTKNSFCSNAGPLECVSVGEWLRSSVSESEIHEHGEVLTRLFTSAEVDTQKSCSKKKRPSLFIPNTGNVPVTFPLVRSGCTFFLVG